MSPLQPATARDLFQRLAELQEVHDDLSPETLARRVGAIVDKSCALARNDPYHFATELQHLGAALAHPKQTAAEERSLAATPPPTLLPTRNS